MASDGGAIGEQHSYRGGLVIFIRSDLKSLDYIIMTTCLLNEASNNDVGSLIYNFRNKTNFVGVKPPN